MAPRHDQGGTSQGRDPSRSKVGRLIEEYGLTGFGADLERWWTGDGVERRSLRELADAFNVRLVRSEMERADLSPLSGEPSNLYELLTSEETSEGERTQARRTLERRGIDVGSLLEDFVSHQAVHTYLTKYRGVTGSESDDRDAVERGLERIQRLRSRTAAVSEHTVENLRDTGRLDIDEFDVMFDLRFVCERCGTSVTTEELFDEGGCGCASG